MDAESSIAPRPKLYQNPFHFFVQLQRQEYEQVNGTVHPPEFSFRDFIGFCAAKWLQMNDEERKPFTIESDKDKARYEKEMKEFDKLSGTTPIPKVTKPKPPYQAYYYYFHSEKSKVLEEYPDMGMAEVAHLLGDKWIGVSSQVRSHFEKIAEEDTKRFEKELEEYEKKCKQFPARASTAPNYQIRFIDVSLV